MLFLGERRDCALEGLLVVLPTFEGTRLRYCCSCHLRYSRYATSGTYSRSAAASDREMFVVRRYRKIMPPWTAPSSQRCRPRSVGERPHGAVDSAARHPARCHGDSTRRTQRTSACPRSMHRYEMTPFSIASAFGAAVFGSNSSNSGASPGLSVVISQVLAQLAQQLQCTTTLNADPVVDVHGRPSGHLLGPRQAAEQLAILSMCSPTRPCWPR